MMMDEIMLKNLSEANPIKLFQYRDAAKKRIANLGESKVTSVIEKVNIAKEVLKYCDSKLKYDVLGSSVLLNAVSIGKIKSLKAIEDYVKWVKVVALGDWRIPAKRWLFRPYWDETSKDKSKEQIAIKNWAKLGFEKGKEYLIPDDFVDKKGMFKEVKK